MDRAVMLTLVLSRIPCEHPVAVYPPLYPALVPLLPFPLFPALESPVSPVVLVVYFLFLLACFVAAGQHFCFSTFIHGLLSASILISRASLGLA
jgi:hypothetical protein